MAVGPSSYGGWAYGIPHGKFRHVAGQAADGSYPVVVDFGRIDPRRIELRQNELR